MRTRQAKPRMQIRRDGAGGEGDSPAPRDRARAPPRPPRAPAPAQGSQVSSGWGRSEERACVPGGGRSARSWRGGTRPGRGGGAGAAPPGAPPPAAAAGGTLPRPSTSRAAGGRRRNGGWLHGRVGWFELGGARDS